MNRIPTDSVEDAPEASRAMLKAVRFSPTGSPLHLHDQMAHSPVVLAAYTWIRKATAEHGTLGQPVAPTSMLTVAGAIGHEYAIGVTTRLASGAGWPADQVAAVLAQAPLADTRIDDLAKVVREAARHSGHVGDAAGQAAREEGRSDQELTEAFASVGLSLFSAHFLNYAQSELDLPIDAPAA